MERIASKTKITQWTIVGEKEKIEFDLCDFSPDQVAALERFVRHPDDQVRVTIECEQKKLQIPALTSPVRLVSLALRAGGQKIKLAGFRSPDERAIALKRLSANETPVVVTIEPIQGELPFGEDAADSEDPPADDLEEAPGERPWRQVAERTLKCKGLRQVAVTLDVQQRGDDWRIGYRARLGHYTVEEAAADADAYDGWPQAMENVRVALCEWIDGLAIFGKTDAVRSMTARRDAMRRQVEDWLAEMIEQGEL